MKIGLGNLKDQFGFGFMQVNQKIYVAFICFLGMGMLVGTGCQSLGFKKPSFSAPTFKAPKIPKPDLGKLAFWKKDDSGNRLPPPPARTFDPPPIDGKTRQDRMASNDRSDRGQFDNLGSDALKELDQFSEPPSTMDRKRYAIDDGPEADKGPDNRFEIDPGSRSNQFVGVGSGSKTESPGGQSAFQAAPSSSINNGLVGTAPGSGFEGNDVAAESFSPSQSANQFAADMASGGFMASPKLGSDSSALPPIPTGTSAPNTNSAFQSSPYPYASSGQSSPSSKPFEPSTSVPPASSWSSPIASNTLEEQAGALAPLPGVSSGFRSVDPRNALRLSESQTGQLQPMVPRIQTNPYYPNTNQPGLQPLSPRDSNMGEAKAAGFDSPGDGGTANRIPSYGEDIFIPDSILNRKGNYSPGSVNRSKPIQ